MEPSAALRDRLTQAEAVARAEQVSNIAYALDLDLEAGAKTYRGNLTISFDHHGGDTFLEWLGGSIDGFEINGTTVEPAWDGSRISLPARLLADTNELRVAYERRYDHTGEGFHQFIDPEDGSEYLYTQFEPYSAHRLMPCFDQPDLKAVYRVAVTAPADWAVVTAGSEVDREDLPDGRVRRMFAETVRFSTYLLAVCAGPFASVHDEHRGVPLGLYCRKSMLEHLDPEPILATTKAGMDFFADLFGEPYPFGKYDQLFVPEFNWGGMENVAAVTYTDTVIFRDPPTQDQLTRRGEYLLHELAHMWFGDLVTLKWWSDLWLNESFASFAAYLALDADGGFPSVWQDFNHRMKLWAYREDQRPTTHRIADEVSSTDETFLNFDGITYGKGAAVLRQLVAAIGLDDFRSGMETYFRRHRFGNATLADFLAALQEICGFDLVHWAARWLRTPSLNTVGVEWEESGGVVTRFDLVQSAPEDHPFLRPHHIEVALIGPEGHRVLPAAFEDARHSLESALNTAAPSFVYPNHGDYGFLKVSLDPVSIAWARARLSEIADPLLRQQVWVSLWEMVRDRTLSSLEYLDLVAARLPEERSLPIVQLVTGTVGGAVSRYVPEGLIDEQAARFVSVARTTIDAAPPGDLRVLWARALVRTAAAPAEFTVAAALVDDPPEGLSIDQEMRWGVAVTGISLGLEDAEDRLSAERERDHSDRGDRAMATAEAARPDPVVKEEVWHRLHSHGYDSLRLAMAGARGFWRRRQRDLLEPYLPRFFAGLPELFAEWEVEAARGYFDSFFPRYRVAPTTRAEIAVLLERDDLGPMLTRMLVEADDDLERALACRAFAAPPVAADEGDAPGSP